MSDEPLIAQLVQSQDVIFNCAAQTSHPLSIQDPLFDAEINCLGNLRLLEAIRLLNPRAVVAYASSSTVVGKATASVIDGAIPSVRSTSTQPTRVSPRSTTAFTTACTTSRR